MKKKSTLIKSSLTSLALLPLISTANAGEVSTIDPSDSVISGRTLADAMPAITNPTRHGLALPGTRAHGMLIHHRFPGQVRAGGGLAPLGGDLNLIALKLEYAVNERLSIVANKDGFIDSNPDATAVPGTGFANLGAGLKYAFIYDPANNFVASVSGTLELPTGNRDVYQGYGDGAVHLTLHALKMTGGWQLSGATGVRLPFDGDAESTTAFASAHVSYAVTEKFTPLLELNIFRTLSEGDGTETPISVVDFEGGDFFNLGSGGANFNRNIVTAAAGFRYKFSDKFAVGAAYEIPLTSEEENLMESRVTFDFVYKF